MIELGEEPTPQLAYRAQFTVKSYKDHGSAETRGIALASAFAALYIAANAMPISIFIGGSGFITAGIILLPVIAIILKPKEAIFASIIASLGLMTFQLSMIPMFGIYGMLIPASGIILGSLGFYKSKIYPVIYVAFGGLWYITFSSGTPAWLIPYLIAIGFALADKIRHFKVGDKGQIIMHSLLATMCELVTMNIGSISLLRLHGELWLIITPFMLIERTVAVAGSSLVILALARMKCVVILNNG
ncbi:MAG: hypothetical protein ACUVTM_07100 [Candidatus Bathyarchaeia archaeon]